MSDSGSEAPRFTVEEIDAAPTPPRARVEDVPVPPESVGERLERKKDYLEGFLSQQPTGMAPNAPGGETYEAVINALKDIYDPEIPVNIYELGLIYGVDISDEGAVAINMTLTTPNCPVAESMPGEVELRVASVPGIRDCEVTLVWEPAWDPAKMSDEARLELGML